MENTPQLQRKSLSLSSRLNKKRHSGSPQGLVKSTTPSNVLKGDFNANSEVPRSPSIYSVCSDGGIECTPPHKKPTVRVGDIGDGDYSPKIFDKSFSPSCFLSQTMAFDSPEVGWKWKRHTASMGVGEEACTRTPDSAYAADSSFTSAGSSSTDMMRNARARSDNYNKRMANDARKEQELRRFEKTRADEKLKQRCAKFQEQLKSAGAKGFSTSPCNASDKSVTPNTTTSTTLMDIEISQTTASTLKLESPLGMNEKVVATVTCEETLNDFFNDSDADYFLLAATQEIESKIDAKHQLTTETSRTVTNIAVDAQKSKSTNSNYNSNSTAITTYTATSSSSSATSETCKTVTQEKRSSFYMKFLEDDCTDDWFISLDEVILQATQSKKPRTSLYRYKSMPTNSNDSKTAADNAVTKSDPMLNEPVDSFVKSASPSSATHSKIKRHSSSHTLSPVNSNYRARQNHLKK